jgi:hypothetical protein
MAGSLPASLAGRPIVLVTLVGETLALIRVVNGFAPRVLTIPRGGATSLEEVAAARLVLTGALVVGHGQATMAAVQVAGACAADLWSGAVLDVRDLAAALLGGQPGRWSRRALARRLRVVNPAPRDPVMTAAWLSTVFATLVTQHPQRAVERALESVSCSAAA